MYRLYHDGALKAEGTSITEGIGQGRVTANHDGFTPDFSWRITDEVALPIVFDLLEDEGLCMGGSTGINIGGAIEMGAGNGAGAYKS